MGSPLGSRLTNFGGWDGAIYVSTSPLGDSDARSRWRVTGPGGEPVEFWGFASNAGDATPWLCVPGQVPSPLCAYNLRYLQSPSHRL